MISAKLTSLAFREKKNVLIFSSIKKACFTFHLVQFRLSFFKYRLIDLQQNALSNLSGVNQKDFLSILHYLHKYPWFQVVMALKHLVAIWAPS